MDENEYQAKVERLSPTTSTGQDDADNGESDPLVRGENLFQKALSSSAAPGSGRVLRFKSNTSQLPSLSCPVMSDLQHVQQTPLTAVSSNSLVENDPELPSTSKENADTGRNTLSSFPQTCTDIIVDVIPEEDPAILLETESLAYERRHRSNLRMNPIFERMDNSSHTTQLASLVTPDLMDNSSRRSFGTDESSGSDHQPPPSYVTVCRKKIQQEQLDNFSTVTNESTQPPTYRDAVGIQRYLEDAPPTYQTLFAQSVFRIIDFNSDGTDGNADERQMSFFGYLLTYLIFSAMVFVTAGMILFLPLAMISVGVKHLRSCPAQPRIPVFLTSLGVFQLLECCGRFSMYVYTKLRTQSQRERARYKSKDPFIYFIVVWFVVGSMWVYQNYPTCHYIVPGETYGGHGRLDGSRIEQVGRRGLTRTTTTATAKNSPPYLPLHVGRKADVKIEELIGVNQHLRKHVVKNSTIHKSKKAARSAQLSSKYSQNTKTNHSQNRKPATLFTTAKYSQNTNGNHSQSTKPATSLTNARFSQNNNANYSQDTKPATSYAWTSTGSLMPTTREPLYKQKAACCGKTVYFFTFWIVTIYYSVIGLLFMVHICGSFVRLIFRCRRDDYY